MNFVVILIIRFIIIRWIQFVRCICLSSKKIEDLKIEILTHYAELPNRLYLIDKTEAMRDEYVEMLIDRGISMNYDKSYESFIQDQEELDPLIAKIENVGVITHHSLIALRYGGNSIESRTLDLISKIKAYLGP